MANTINSDTRPQLHRDQFFLIKAVVCGLNLPYSAFTFTQLLQMILFRFGTGVNKLWHENARPYFFRSGRAIFVSLFQTTEAQIKTHTCMQSLHMKGNWFILKQSGARYKKTRKRYIYLKHLGGDEIVHTNSQSDIN